MRLIWKRWLVLYFGLMTAWGVWAQATCERYELLTPKRGSQITERQPELQWGGETNSSYRVQVAVVLPEGRVLESIDTVVIGTRWRFGAPVSVLTSAVKVIVSRNCSSYSVQDLHAQGPHFVIQAAEHCALKPRSLQQQGDALYWSAPTHADKFLIQVFVVAQTADGAATARRIGDYEISGAAWTLPASIKALLDSGSSTGSYWVATVQARCGTLWSYPQAVPLRATP